MSTTFKAAVVQAAPVFMDLDASIDKAVGLIQRAANEGAQLIAFSETWFPGYPWWIWLAPAAHNLQYFQRYHENSLVVGSAQFQRIANAAKENNIYVSAGASEREHGSLYMAQFLFSNTGELLQSRRKLKATHVERSVFGDGDGRDFMVSDTELGIIGQLCCWEHIQPLSKYAMYSMNEQVHIAAWPSFSTYQPQAYSLGAQANMAASSVYALEGGCYVLSPTAIVDQAMYDMLVTNDQQAELISLGGGSAQIFGPDGQAMCESIPESEEGILFAEIDLGAIAVAKSFADPVGHYSRPDVLKLLLNKEPQQRVENFASPSVELTNNSADEAEENSANL